MAYENSTIPPSNLGDTTIDEMTTLADNVTSSNTTAAGGLYAFMNRTLTLPRWVFIFGGLLVGCVYLLILIFILVTRCKRKRRSGKKKSGTDKERLIHSKSPSVKYGSSKEGRQSSPNRGNTGGKNANTAGKNKGVDDDDMLDSDSDTEEPPFGRLNYSLDYIMDKQELIVGVIQAADLPAMDSSGLSDPYVKVNFAHNKKKKAKTKVQTKTLTPIWNEYFNFKIPFANVNEETLIFSIYDFDRFEKDDMIGRVLVPLASVNLMLTVDNWTPLTDPIAEEDTIALGDVCFTLHYVPNSGKLTVIVLECRALKKIGSQFQLPNPYVKIQIFSGNKKLKKRQTEVQSQTINPYFNEPFTFDISEEDFDRISLVVTVRHQSTKLGQSSQIIGHVTLGNQATGSEFRHWSDMVKNPRKPICQWHQLLDVNESSQDEQ